MVIIRHLKFECASLRSRVAIKGREASLNHMSLTSQNRLIILYPWATIAYSLGSLLLDPSMLPVTALTADAPVLLPLSLC